MATATPARTEQTCYRHRDRETGVACSNCGRPICTECMTSTPVGMRCPECTRQRTQVRSLSSLTPEPQLTKVLIGLSVIAYVSGIAAAGGGLSGGTLFQRGALFGPAVAAGEWWRLVTSGFLHAGLVHVGFNMFALWYLGQLLEPALGRVRFGLIYLVALLGGSLGVMLLEPATPAVGASGAIFGLFGAALVALRARGISVMQSGLGPVLLLNLGITFLVPNIAIGAHLGGLAAGALAALVLTTLGERKGSAPLAYALCVGLGVAAFVGAIVVARSPLVQ